MASTTEGDRQGRRSEDGPRLEDPARSASEAVRRAAAVLEGELASSMSGLHRLREAVTEERRIDQEAFDDVLRRLKANGRELIEVSANRIGDLRQDDVQELAAQFSSHAQDLFDTTVSLVTMVPDILNRLAARGEERLDEPDEPGRTQPPGGAKAPRGTKATGGTKAPKGTKSATATKSRGKASSKATKPQA